MCSRDARRVFTGVRLECIRPTTGSTCACRKSGLSGINRVRVSSGGGEVCGNGKSVGVILPCFVATRGYGLGTGLGVAYLPFPQLCLSLFLLFSSYLPVKAG